MLARMLKLEGVCDLPHEASDGAEGLLKLKASMVERDPYDVVIMDYVMPVMSGPEATAAARECGYRGVMLGLTGNAQLCDLAAFKASGLDGVLIKPLDRETFRAMLFRFVLPVAAGTGASGQVESGKSSESVAVAGAGVSAEGTRQHPW